MDYHVSALEEALSSGSLATDMIETLKQAYLNNEMGIVFPIMKALMPESGNGEGAAKFQETLLVKRNVVMVERMLPILQSRSALVAVGALHLPYDTGIVTLLRDNGFDVTPLK